MTFAELKKYRCVACGGSGKECKVKSCCIYDECKGNHKYDNCPYSGKCPSCHGTGYRDMVEKIEIVGVPEGYEFFELRENKAVFCYGDDYYEWGFDIPYTIGQVEDIRCVTCQDTGKKVPSYCEDQPNCTGCKHYLQTECLDLLKCPTCKGKKLKRVVVDIRVEGNEIVIVWRIK